ncbi:MAG: hypothetical protein GY720_15955 [bacterium]|nr:hypothetical protein [bacterium]
MKIPGPVIFWTLCLIITVWGVETDPFGMRDAEAAPKPNPLEAKVRVLERKITAMEARQDAIYRWSNKVDEKLWPRPKKKVK